MQARDVGGAHSVTHQCEDVETEVRRAKRGEGIGAALRLGCRGEIECRVEDLGRCADRFHQMKAADEISSMRM